MTSRIAAHEAAADRPRVRAGHLAALLAAAGGVILWQLIGFAAPSGGLGATWWMIGGGFAIAQIGAIRLRVRRDAHRIALMELPLIFGLASLSPAVLVLSRLGGEAVAALWPPQQAEKLAFNLSLFFLETAAAVSVYRGVLLDSDPASPQGWVAALAAVVASLLVDAGAVTLVLRLHDPGRSTEQILSSLSTGIAISLGTGLSGVVAIILVDANAWSLFILGAGGGLLFVGLRVFESLFRRHQALESVHGFSESVGNTLDLDVVVRNTLREAQRVFHAADALLLWRVRDKEFRRLHSRGGEPVVEDMESTWLAGGVMEALDGGEEPVVVGREDPISAYAAAAGIHRGLAVPLVSGAEPLGLLVIGNGADALFEFDNQDIQLLKTVARQSVVALERGRLLQDMRRQAEEREYESLHDTLTGLPNRVAFTKAIEKALAERDDQHLLAVAILDLDRFKEINDTLGHHHGDIVLTEMASRLRARVRRGDVVARLGGDEFGILVTGLRTESSAVLWTQRMADALADPLVYDGLSLMITGSVGVAIAPEHGTDANTLLRRADVAMYSAKRGGTQLETYAPQHDPHSTMRLAIIGELGHAIEDRQLVVHYQPKVGISNGVVIGMEALVRWQHPRFGLMPPPDFIELAETTGLIVPLTRFVLETALSDTVALNAAGHDLSISVNISPRCFADGGLPETVNAVLQETGLEPQRLILEITETSAVADSSASIAALKQLAEGGVQLSVDDFGTGYSSLAYLTALPVHEMKIDRSFVGTMDSVVENSRIVDSSIAMGRGIGLHVVAEGVESEQAWQMLREMGCDSAQGFLFSKPLPLDRVREFLDTWSPPGF